MSIVKKTIQGSSLLSGSEILSQACSMLRNIILARILAKEDFGVAALLGLILTLFEMTGKMAFGQQLIQSKNGDDPSYINSIHFTQLALSTTSTVLILLSAWPLAHFVAGPQYLGSLLLLASVPFINGFGHLDVHRRTRSLNYVPIVLSETIPQVVATLAAWPLAIYFKDYRAVLWILIGRSIIYNVITHILAEHRFIPRYNREWFKEGLKFGWPLLLGGFLQIGNFQGDSMVVGATYTLAQLGEYSVAMTVAMTPGFAILRISHSIALPLLSEVQNDLAKLSERYGRYVEMMALLSCAATLGMMFCGEQVIVLFFKAKYAGVGALASLLIAAQGLRIIRGATVGAAMARGDTVNNLVANLWRLSGLVLAVIVGWLHGSLAWFALTGFAGEAAALTVSVFRLRKQHSIAPWITLKPTLLAISCALTAAVLRQFVPISIMSWWNWPLLIVVLLFTIAVFLLSLPELRTITRDLLGKVNARLGSPLPAAWWTIKPNT